MKKTRVDQRTFKLKNKKSLVVCGDNYYLVDMNTLIEKKIQWGEAMHHLQKNRLN
jgi:hypothetical protein